MRSLFRSILLLTCLAYARERSVTPPTDEYERTLAALDHYRILAAEDDGIPLPDAGIVAPGALYPGVPALVHLLTRLGDLPEDADNTERYDGALVDAVKKFQARHGLEVDAIIGPATLEQLNTPLSVRVRQLELALKRWRHCPYDPTRPAIVLNLPEFRLRAFGGSSVGPDPELEMNIIVGEGPDHRTPTLRSRLDTIIFRPSWTVPASIQRNELLPEIERNRSWISANRFELINQRGERAGDGRVSDAQLSALRRGELTLRQKPGPKNTLGLVMFVFPNEYGVYMHDTSARWVFTRPRRDLSHGCIRVERPEDLAEWALSKQPGWSRERIEEAIEGTESVHVKVTRPIQLVTMYLTAVVTRDGEVHFLRDIYGEDHLPDRSESR
jgi:murein L,D-transpeptidase YcbB/YkuD